MFSKPPPPPPQGQPGVLSYPQQGYYSPHGQQQQQPQQQGYYVPPDPYQQQQQQHYQQGPPQYQQQPQQQQYYASPPQQQQQAPYAQPAMGMPVVMMQQVQQVRQPAILTVDYEPQSCCIGRRDTFNIKVDRMVVGSVGQGQSSDFRIQPGLVSVAAEERGLFGGESLGAMFGTRNSHAGSVVLNVAPGQRYRVRLYWDFGCCQKTRPLLVAVPGQ